MLLGLWTIVCVFPLCWAAVTSLKDEAAVLSGPRFVPFADFTPVLDAWVFILADAREHLLWRLLNSAVVGTASTLLTLALGSMAIYGLTRLRFTHGDGLLALLLATRILPPVIVVLPLYLMAQQTGTLDTRVFLVLTYTAANLPVALWLLWPVFGVKATDQEEAALLDGATRLTIFLTIAVPMARGGIAAAGLLIFTLCWNEYLLSAFLASGNAVTLPPWLVGQLSIKEAQVGSDSSEWPQLSAAIVLMALPLLAGAGFAQRFLGRTALRR